MKKQDGDCLKGKYDDMIEMVHPQSKTRPHMSLRDRAAQFAPFAALTGHEEAIRETARLAAERVEHEQERDPIWDE